MSDITCPFCGEEGFDKPGLKFHLERYCEEYRETEDIALLVLLAQSIEEGHS